MTETDAAATPVDIPITFLPYLEKHRLYKLFKDMMQDLVVHMPRDHLLHMKQFLQNMARKDAVRLVLLVSPELGIDIPTIVRAMVKDFGLYVITRRSVLGQMEKHDDYKPGCVNPALMSEVTKAMTIKDEVVQNGWLMFDHPCTLREARCLQQDGVLPTVTLAVSPTPPVAAPAVNNRTPMRTFFDQDFEALKYAYRATLKEVHVDPNDSMDTVVTKCFNGVLACAAGAQGSRQGFHATGAPGVYRVALIGPRGAGRRTQAHMAAKHFNLVDLHFTNLYYEAKARDDEIGARLREHGPSVEMKAEIVRRRLLQKDCVSRGYVITGYPTTGEEFELFEHMDNPPNRIVFMNSDFETCEKRIKSRAVDWCTGRKVPVDAARTMTHPGNADDVIEKETCEKRIKSRAVDWCTGRKVPSDAARTMTHPGYADDVNEKELDFYFSEGVAEMRAAAGLTAWEVDASKPIDEVQTKILAAIMAAPSNDMKCYSTGGILDNARAD